MVYLHLAMLQSTGKTGIPLKACLFVWIIILDFRSEFKYPNFFYKYIVL